MLIELFLVFFQIGLFSFGGGYAAMPLIQSLVVEQHGWLTIQEYADLTTIAEMTPGPIMVNAATFTGQKMAGFLGSVADVGVKPEAGSFKSSAVVLLSANLPRNQDSLEEFSSRRRTRYAMPGINSPTGAYSRMRYPISTMVFLIGSAIP